MARIGETLKKAREIREIDLREISDATKINIRYLEAIEANQFDALPGGVFNKGFIRAYANYIGLDGQAMVDNYVHDVTAGTDDAPGPDPAPAGLHRPTENPPRRTPPLDSDRGESGAGAGSSIKVNSSQVPAPLHITGLQDVTPDRAASSPQAGDPSALPRIAWLIAATGLLFGLLVAWKYIAGTPPAPVGAEQTLRSQPAPSGPSPATPGLDAEDTETTQLAGAVAAVPEDAAPSDDNNVMIAAPKITLTTPTATPNDTNSTEQPAPTSRAVESAPAGKTPEADSPAEIRAAPIPGPEVESLQAEKDDQGMTIVITALTATRLRIICDGREAADREMRRGDVESLRCERLIRLSAPDAANIRLTINGASCRSLGAPGSRLFGYVIRADDYRGLCSGHTEETDAAR